MKTFKFIIFTIFLYSTFGTSSVHAQIPVTDTAAISKSWTAHMAEIAKWTEQLRAMEQQYSQLRMQYDSITGSRGLGQLMNNASRQTLPDDFIQSYNRLLTLGQTGASSAARRIYENIKKLDCDRFHDSNAKLQCQAQAYAEPENAAFINDALKSSQERAAQLQQLVLQVDRATDLKAATDLSNRIAAEQSLLQNEHTLINLALSQRQSQSALVVKANEAEGRRAILENRSSVFGSLE
ncbi:Type IV secretion system protein virB5 (plasmid) [Nitrosomonas stercoris]|uniref:Type IV secretion system protein virB5 n=1 Tax=Nitrosomonas stercoris TaxID=1444684 RepID=A0A4Y1YS03_9PROT|nr:Type IV secretion system protein virB5 [Nitrosomonas stercoris]